jgi:hypothetical protein
METWDEMRARHMRERVELVESLAQSRYTQTQAFGAIRFTGLLFSREKRVTKNQRLQYLKRIVRLCAAHKANPNQQKNEIDEIRALAQHIIDVDEKDTDIEGSPV